MKVEIENSVEILNDLLRINNDRVAGYRKGAEEIQEIDLRTLFNSMADESKRNAADLSREIKKNGGVPASGMTTTFGKIYRVWMDVKAKFTGQDRQSILDSCEFGEDAAQTAYGQGIASADLSSEARQLIRNQQIALKASHDLIKSYRNGEIVYSRPL
jgi:uncharacterized protein (TIGR02284 family)